MSLARWRCETSVIFSNEDVNGVSCVLAAVFPGFDVSDRVLALEEVFR